jgi:hypothetical protein
MDAKNDPDKSAVYIQALDHPMDAQPAALTLY